MKNPTPIYFALTLILLFACVTKKNSTTETSSPTPKDSKEQYPQAEIDEFSKVNDAYDLKSVKIEGNFMIFEVSYSGGCEQHEFRLIGSKMLSKSLPPIRAIQLAHNGRGDKCKSIVTEKLKFSISNLAYNTDAGNKIILQLENYSPTFEYSYE